MDLRRPQANANPAPPDRALGPTTEARLSTLSSLLQNLDVATPTVTPPSARAVTETNYENRLVQVRLGMASALFAALRAKHAPTATHCLRVALGCSTLAWVLELPDADRDALEVAALLHDVGKIGVPDAVLLKPGRLTGNEVLAMDRQLQFGLEIMQQCTSSPQVLDIVRYAPAWFNGAKHGFNRSGAELPLGARLLAIVDAFDSMTTDHVYRRALSRERAVAEMFEFAGTQFDPDLIKVFSHVLSSDWVDLQARVTSRWLHELQPETVASLWTQTRGTEVSLPVVNTRETLFHDKLLENMRDGVMFVNRELVIEMWNRGAERLTGVTAESLAGKRWLPSLVSMRDDRGRVVTDEECPVQYALQSGVQTLRRMLIQGRNGAELAVDLHVMPVFGADGAAYGATLMLHDSSSEATLEERVQALYERATHDPLTKVANRAEFDRVHAQFVETHLKRRLPCSLIICDIDHFKRINDTYGHQAGDEALVGFAALLKRHCQTGDLAARYGGEEFVMLLADCDIVSAAKRADAIRRDLAALEHSALGGRSFTASFGVTEMQPGDTPDTMLRRADRALLAAKDQGRNRVVQLGGGSVDAEPRERRRGWWGYFFGTDVVAEAYQRTLSTPVPLNLTAEKLRGFIADHHAQLIKVESERVIMQLNGCNAPLARRTADRAVAFRMELTLRESREEIPEDSRRSGMRTMIDVAIRPVKGRDRRRRDLNDRARHLLVSLKSYLMAHEHEPEAVVVSENGRGAQAPALAPVAEAAS